MFTADAVLDGAQGRYAGREALRASVGPIWAAEGPAAPPAIRAAAVITQELRRSGEVWRISRRTVAPTGR